MAPTAFDRLLAGDGYGAQQTDEADQKDRPDHLMAPLPGDHGTRGRFGREARARVLIVDPAGLRAALATEIGRASFRACVCQYVSFSFASLSFTKTSISILLSSLFSS